MKSHSTEHAWRAGSSLSERQDGLPFISVYQTAIPSCLLYINGYMIRKYHFRYTALN